MGKLKEAWEKVGKDWSAQVSNELKEHPWLTRDQAEQVVRDHRAGKKMLQQRDLAYPIMAYKGTKLPTTDNSIAGISKNLAGKSEQPIMVHLVNKAWCPQCKRRYESGAKVIRNVWKGKTSYCCPVDGAILSIQG